MTGKNGENKESTRWTDVRRVFTLFSPMRRGTRDQTNHQSLGRMSPASGVSAIHHVVGLMVRLTKRTLPSPIPALMPPVCGELAARPSQKAGSPAGFIWNI